MVSADDRTCTRAAQLAVAVAAAAAEISDMARDLVPATDQGYGGLTRDAQAILDRAQQLLLLAVAADRRRHATWREIGEAAGTDIREAAAQFAAPVAAIDDAVIENWLDTATGSRPDLPVLSPAASDPASAARELDDWADPSGGRPVSRGLQYLDDGEHAFMISAACHLLDRRRADGTSPGRIWDLEYGLQYRTVESYRRMLDNPIFSSGREAQMQDRLDKALARLSELDEARFATHSEREG